MSGRARGRARGRERPNNAGPVPRPGPPPRGNGQRNEMPSRPGDCLPPGFQRPGARNPNGNGCRAAGRGAPANNGAEASLHSEPKPGTSGANGGGDSGAQGNIRSEPRLGTSSASGDAGAGNRPFKDRDRQDVQPFTLVGVPRPAMAADQTAKVMMLTSNHYKVQATAQHNLYQYDIKFDPDVDDFSQRTSLISQHRSLFPIRIFDGNSLYSPSKLQYEVCNPCGLVMPYDTRVQYT